MEDLLMPLALIALIAFGALLGLGIITIMEWLVAMGH